MVISEFAVPIALFICLAATAIGVPIAKAVARKLDRDATPPQFPPDFANRLERMEQTMDSVAIEVERLSESQRFTAKLLAERAKGPDGQLSPERKS